MNKVFLILCMVSMGVLLNGCVLGHSRGILVQGTEQVRAAPEVRGANKEIQPRSNFMSVRGGMRLGKTETVRAGSLENDLSDIVSCEDCEGPISNYRYAKLFYEIAATGPYATFEYLHKFKVFTIGVSAGYDNGAYVSPVIGANFKNFEFGATLAMETVTTKYKKTAYAVIEEPDCYGWLCEDSADPGDSEIDVETKDSYLSYAPGIYFAFFIDRFSISYSGSMFQPNNFFDDVKTDEDHLVTKLKDDEMPTVLTNHISVGYNITDEFVVRLGLTNVYGEFPGWHWSGSGGVEYQF